MSELHFLSQLTGCFAQPVDENPTVVMVEAAYRHHGLNARYINIEVGPDNLGGVVAGAKAMGWIGFNCSIPNKLAVIKHLDGIGESASVIGAVNCAVLRDGKFIGENTDGKGFLKSLEGVIDPAGKTVVMFGAGGAARAVGVELALAGASKIIVVNRDEVRGKILVDLINTKTKTAAEFVSWSSKFSIPAGTDIVINSTSIGLFPDIDAQLNIDFDTLRAGIVVADVIPNPPKTHLLRQAKARGCVTLDGLGMLVNQGVIGIKYWTGIDADPGVMRKALEEVFG
ncbi:MAG: shikimate dehydrogenase [Actinobacteria bacterium]|uniref:shikimate dehydrogenase (NADP(+)) n=1 Tax=freshwater metagenome TaxID=449393 RepID=A0A6J6ZIT0_9ZZZZ|nr:shikimate dehydrogenase [Actinomycetota bacterium]MSW22499.1 shikimate dehydrogenase [Actinomycetota bacterium]MSX03972.1 shikimate dehydrogenase [Actinomycetota bacterium]MSX61576.1 shikimate dehydrogenase [Actinomycetota bacterium]MSX84129.1 shikimate dehydrogenase [Actinomycetota bacterium]